MSEKRNVVRELIETGKRNGRLTTKEINDALEEINFDVEQVDKLYETLESHNVEVVDEPDPDVAGFTLTEDSVDVLESALSAEGVDGVLIYGVDFTDDAKAAIQEGKMTGSMSYSSARYTKAALQMAVMLNEGETFDSNVYLPLTLVNVDNVNSLEIYKRNARGKIIYEDIKEQIEIEKQRTKERFVKHFEKKYQMQDLPLWACVELLSFGGISKFFSILKDEDQKSVLQNFGLSFHPKPFQNWLMGLTTIRNICAHHARLWNREVGTKFVIPKKTNFLHSNVNNKKIFFALSVLAEILKDSSIKSGFKALLDKYPTIPTRSMGIPQYWGALSPWSNL